MLKLLIADNSDDFVELLCQQLSDSFEISQCNDGYEVIPLLYNTSPDLLLLDLMLPGCDGLTVLESICAMPERPVILAVSRVYSFYVHDSLEKLGVSYAMQKPCDVNAVCNRLKELAQYPKSQLLPVAEEEETISATLRALGFSSKHMGYRCLVEAIRLILHNPDQLYTKELYPAVGQIFGCNWRQVERDIRTSISLAWENRNAFIWQEFLSGKATPEKKPTNSTFIAAVGQLLRKCLAADTNNSK